MTNGNPRDDYYFPETPDTPADRPIEDGREREDRSFSYYFPEEVDYDDYDLTFWEDPRNVVYYRNMFESMGEEQPYPDWLDPAAIYYAYDHFAQANEGRDPDSWWKLHPDDEFRGVLQRISPPPDDYKFPGDMKYLQPEEPVGDKPPEDPYYETGGIPTATYEQLPWFRKLLVKAFGSGAEEPTTADMMQSGAMIGGSAAMFEGTLENLGRGGIRGGIAGAGAGIVLGGTLGGLASKYPAVGKLFEFFDVPETWVEQVAGTVGITGAYWAQLAATGGKTEDYLDVLENIDKVWQVAALTYDVTDLRNLIPGHQAAGLIGTEEGEVLLTPTAAEPTPLGFYETGVPALSNAYTELRDGTKNIDEISEELIMRHGFTGQLRDMTYKTLASPWNVLGVVAVKGGLLTVRAAAKVLTGIDLTQGVGALFVDVAKNTRGFADFYVQWRHRVPKELTPAQMSEMSASAKAVSGVTPEGHHIAATPMTKLEYFRKDGKPSAFRQGWRQLSGLTPEAQAREAGGAIKNMLFHMASAETDPVSQANALRSFKNLKPDEARALGLLVDNAYFEGAHLVLQSLDSDIAKHLKEFELGREGGRIQLLETLAEALDMDIHTLVDDLGSDRKANVIFNEYMKRLAKSGTAEAQTILTKADEGVFSSRWIQEAVTKYVDEKHAYDSKTFLSSLLNKIEDRGEAHLGKYYGVDPIPGWQMAGQAIKAMQSILLLGLNPVYLANNVLNNIVTMAAEGLVGRHMLPSARTKLWNRIGYSPSRRGTLAGMAGELFIGKPEGAIAKMTRRDIIWQTLTDKSRSFSEKWAIISRASHKVERHMTDMALSQGTFEYLSKNKRIGKLLDALEPTLEGKLRLIDEGLPERIHNALESNYSPAEVTEAIYARTTYQVGQAFTDTLAARHNKTPSHVAQTFDELGVYDFVNERIRGGKVKTDVDVYNMFGDLKKELYSTVNKQRVEQLGFENLKQRDGYQLAGAQDFLYRYDSVLYDHYSTLIRSDRILQEAFDFDAANPGSGAVTDAFQLRDELWGHQLEKNKMVLNAFSDSIGAKNAVVKDIIGSADGIGKTWTNYHKTVRKMWNDHYTALVKGMPDDVAAVERAKIITEQNRLATEAFEFEYAKQGEINKHFVDMFVVEYGADVKPAVKGWLDGHIEIRRKMQAAVADLRASIPLNFWNICVASMLTCWMKSRVGWRLTLNCEKRSNSVKMRL
jgi:hypothetical protein